MQLPVLYQKGKSGETLVWKIWTVGSKVIAEHGKLGGKQIRHEYIAKPKNVGKANATTAVDQANAEAKATWDNKLARKYSETIEETQVQLMLPMLAHKYEDRRDKLQFPMHIQPKLDGVRSLARWNGTRVVLLSRQGKEWTAVPHINTALEPFFRQYPKTVLDGELYVHNVGLQAISRLVKKNRPGPRGSEQVYYAVYDMPTSEGRSDLQWKDRYENLGWLGRHLSKSVTIVPTMIVDSHEDIEAQRMKYVEDGYEGAILRILTGKYAFGHRSSDLLKVKHFIDDEFKVLDVIPFDKMPECGVFIVEVNKIKPGVQCKVLMKASMEERAKILRDRKKWIGKKLTVRFQRYTEDGSLFIPTGHAERLKEDQ
jgi:DNA ligase-1